MDLTPVERVILERFFEKMRSAGGVRVGYMLRKRAVTWIQEEHPDLDFEQGLRSLRERDLLKMNEGGDLFYLTAAGAEVLETAGLR